MHSNPAFRQEAVADNLAFARARGFGVLAVNGEAGPVLAHVPFLIAADASHALVHLTRSNPIARLAPVSAVIAVSGPDAYISPDWYGVADQVPTWNYVAVHLRGLLQPMPEAALRRMVEELSDHFEAGLAPKPAWTTAKMGEGVMERMMRMILPFRLEIATIEGTWKLNQNKTAAQRAGVIRALDGGRQSEMAALMRALDPE
jgi:transcriptional regulator